MIQHLCILWSDHHNKSSDHLSLYIVIRTGTLENKADSPRLLSLLPLIIQHHLLIIYLKVLGVFCPGETGWDSVAGPFTPGLFLCLDNFSPTPSLPLRPGSAGHWMWFLWTPPDGRSGCPHLGMYGLPDLHYSLTGREPFVPTWTPCPQPGVWWRATWPRQAALHFGHFYTQPSSPLPAELACLCASTDSCWFLQLEWNSRLLPWLRVSLYLFFQKHFRAHSREALFTCLMIPLQHWIQIVEFMNPEL